MHLQLLALLFVFISFTTKAQTEPADKARVKYDFSLYLPKDYQTNKRNYPLVIYLHGGSQRGNDLTKLHEYGPPQLVK